MRVSFTAWMFLTLFFLAAVPGCHETPSERYARRLRETDDSQRHAVHSERLMEVMTGLKALTHAALPQELDVEMQQDQRRAEVSAIADAMSTAAGMIPAVLTDVELPGEQANTFRTLASTLARQCHDLGQSAQDLPLEELDRELSEILNTCDSCHTRFRILPAIQRTATPE